MKSIAMNNGGPLIPRSKSRAIVRSSIICGSSRWPIPGGVVHASTRQLFIQFAVRLPRFAPAAWWIGGRTWAATNAHPMKINGAARDSPAWTLLTTTPTATASTAGSAPRNTVSAHHPTASPGAAR
jgi:hypothetical protein